MYDHLYDLDAHIRCVIARRDRSVAVIWGGTAVLASQLVLMASVGAEEGASEAERFGASIAEGMVSALAAPLMYAALGLLLVFGVLAVVYQAQYRDLLDRRRRLLTVPVPPPRGPVT